MDHSDTIFQHPSVITKFPKSAVTFKAAAEKEGMFATHMACV